MLDGENYYNCELSTGLVHGFMSNMIDEKVQYLLGKEPTLKCEIGGQEERLKELLGNDFLYQLQGAGIEASNKGIAWLQAYIDENGLFKLLLVPSEQICPIWKDRQHTQLESLLRVYEQETYNGAVKEMVTHVIHYEKDGVTYYTLEHDTLVLDSEKYLNIPDDVAKAGHFTSVRGGEVFHESFGEIPFVWVKNNRNELNDLQFVKTLIDDYNAKREEVSEVLTDCKNFIYNIRNYGGDEDDDILSMIKEKRRIFTDEDGGVEILTPSIDITAAQTHWETLKKDIEVFGKSVPRGQENLGTPSGIALKFMYSGLDLKCNGLENELKFMFQRLLLLLNTYLGFSREKLDKVEIIFNRDITINEQEAIQAVKESYGIISKKTAIANHPFVTNLDEELQQLEEEAPTLDDYTNLGGGADGEE